MNKNISVCFASDDGYANYLCIAIYSLLFNLDKKYTADIYVLDSGISEKHKNFILEKVKEVGNGNVSFLKINSDKYLSLERGHLKKETYLRLELPTILPHLEYILYLDVDVIIDGDVAQIYNYDISKYALGAVLDMGNYNHYKYLLNIPSEYGYFNAGVCFLNLGYMRKYNVSDQIISYLYKTETLLSCDQDAMNAILYNARLSINPKFNFHGVVNKKMINILFKNHHEFMHPKDKPVIIHYIGAAKPWNIFYINALGYKIQIGFMNCKHKFKERYFFYRSILDIHNDIVWKRVSLKQIFFFFYSKFYNLIDSIFPSKYVIGFVKFGRKILSIR